MSSPVPVLSRDPQVHSGDVVFAGTRVPLAAFVEQLKDGGSVDDFLEGYPTVERWQALALLDQLASESVERALVAAAPSPGAPSPAPTRAR
jgi:uncharacterized protein (DUF433 family)